MRYAIPVIVLAGLVALFVSGLGRNPGELPSPLIGKPAPAFSLPALAAETPLLSPADLMQQSAGEPVLVNFFASWCAGCEVEHAYLLELARGGQARIVGIDYKDTRDDVRAWLARHGDPYAQVLVDLDGRAGIDWGVYGVPETFVLDTHGTIVYKHVGPLTPQAWAQELRPRLERLRAAS